MKKNYEITQYMMNFDVVKEADVWGVLDALCKMYDI